MEYRSELPKLPDKMKSLPIDERGYPVPWFVQYVDGKPDFRIMDSAKRVRAIRERLCWVCGGRLGVHFAFVIGPMCAINRVSSEPPSHLVCADYSARACPFLTTPKEKRRTALLPPGATKRDGAGAKCPVEQLEINMPGFGIMRNPGVTLVWTTRSYRVFGDGMGDFLIQVGEPEETIWYREGGPARRDEVMESINSGYPILQEKAKEDAEPERALKLLAGQYEAMLALLPAV